MKEFSHCSNINPYLVTMYSVRLYIVFLLAKNAAHQHNQEIYVKLCNYIQTISAHPCQEKTSSEVLSAWPINSCRRLRASDHARGSSPAVLGDTGVYNWVNTPECIICNSVLPDQNELALKQATETLM